MIEQEDAALNGFLIISLCDLAAKETMPAIEAAFADDRVDETIVSLAEVQEHFGLPASYPGLREVNVYLGWFGPLARPIQAGSFVGDVVRKVPLTTYADALARTDDDVKVALDLRN